MLSTSPLARTGDILASSVASLKRLGSPNNRSRRLVDILQKNQAIADQTAVAETSLIAQLRNTRLGDTLHSAISEIATYAAELDQRYQGLVRTYVDPVLVSQQRSEQLQTLKGDRDLALSAHEKKVNRDMVIGIGAVAAVGIANLTGLPLIPLVIATGIYLTLPFYKIAWRMAVQFRRFSVAHLLVLYFTGLWLGGYYTIGAIGITLASVAKKVMLICENNMRNNLVTIFGEQPRRVWVVVDGVEMEIPFDQLSVGDTLVLDVGQMVPIDGVIVQGSATLDQHMLTGEAQPIEKTVGDPVLAATVVLGGRVHVRVEKAGSETTAAQIGEILNNSAEHRLSMEQKAIAIAEKSLLPMLAASAVALPLAGVSSAVAILGSNFIVNMIPLRLLTMLNFLNATSHHGILVKDADALEKLKEVTTVVFDKTGTLTLERPHVVQIHAEREFCTEQVLAYAAAAEHRQTHPIAQAILAAAAEQAITVPAVEDAYYEVGYGIKVKLPQSHAQTVNVQTANVQTANVQTDDLVHNLTVRVGSLRFMEMEGVTISSAAQELQERCHANGHSLVFVALEDTGATEARVPTLMGAIELQATVRPEAKGVIAALLERGLDLYIISGDHDAPTRQLAAELNIPHYFAGVLPESKANLVAQLQEDGHKVCFIGDGINDAIALQQADVSISLRGATTAATDTAQVVLMDADLSQFITLFQLAEALDQNIDRNFKMATALSLLSGAGILFLHLKFVAVEVLAAVQLMNGVKIANQPLADQAQIAEGS